MADYDLHIDVVADDSSFSQTMQNVRENVRKTKEIIEQSGTSVEDFFKKIRDNEKVLEGLNVKIDLTNPTGELEKFDKQVLLMVENLNKYFDSLQGKLKDMSATLGNSQAIAGGIPTDNSNAQQLAELQRQNNELIEQIKQRQAELEKERTIYNQLAEAVRTNNVPALQQLAQLEDEASKRLNLDAARGSLKDITQDMDALAQRMKKTAGDVEILEARIVDLKDLQAGNDPTATDEVIAKEQKALDDKKAKLEEMKAEYNEMAALQKQYSEQVQQATGHHVRMRTQIMNAREEMMQMIAAGKRGTPEFQELAEHAGQMRRQMALANATMQYFADPNRNLTTLKVGLQGVAGAAGLVTGVMGVFNAENEKMAQIQTKVQSILSIIVGLQTTYNLVKKTSNIMLAIEEVKTWAVAKARGVQTAATVAATGAQEALNTAMRTNPIGAFISLLAILGTAIYAIVKAITSETEAEKKAREEAENLAKTYQTKYAESLGSTILKYKQMQAEYEALRTEHEKTQWITDNKNKIDEFGVAVNNVSDAERFFKEDTDNVVRAFMLRAQAAGIAAQAEEQFKNATFYQAGQEISPEDMNKFGFHSNGRGQQTVNKKVGTFSNTYTLTGYGAEQANAQVLDKTIKDVEAKFGKVIEMTAEANKEMGSLSNNINKTEYEILHQQRENFVQQKRALSEADAAGKAGQELQLKIDAIDKRLEVYSDKKKTTGGNGNTDNKDSANRQKQLEDEWKYQEELKKIKQEGADAAADAEIASEQDAALREHKMRKEQHERKIRELNNQVAEIYKAIYEQRKKAYEAENKGKYTDTTAGALGWGEEDMKGTLTDKEREYFMARYAVIAAGLAEEKAVWARYEQEREREHVLSMRDFLKEYGNELEQELAITQDYQEKIDKARAEGDKGKALMLERKMQEALSDAKLKNLKKSTDYVRAFENLSNASSDTLKSLITKFEAAKESAAQNLSPDQLREYTSTLQQMYDELDSRNPFDILVKSLKELAEAQKELKSAQGIYDRVMAGDTVINDKTGQAYTEEEATRRLTEAKDNEARVYTRLTKATTSCASRLNSFADTLSNLGNMVGGKLGKSLGALGGVLGSVGGAFDNIKSINVNATGIEKTMGQISAVAGTVSAMIEMNKQLDSILPDQESLYEYYAAKQSEINKKRQQLLELEIAQMNERLQNEHWFYENGLTQLKKNAELNAEYAKAYGEIAAAPQEVYKEAKSGFSKWAPAIIGAVVGIVAGVLTFGAGAGAGAALGAAIGSAIGGTAIGAALGSTVIAMIGTAIFSGVGAALGNAVRAGIDGIMYDPNQTAAINNMRVQTRHKTFFRSEKTQDLKSWVKENWGQDLFEDVKGVQLIDTEVAKKLLEEGPTLVGETRETLEKLMEYSEKIREFIEQIHEYVSSAFSPLLDNLVDALWDWLSSGKDVLDSFREYAADTFKNIAQDALKAMTNKLIFEPFQEQLENLTIAYATNQVVDGVPMDETAYMAGVAAFAAQAQEAIESNLPVLQNAAEVIQKSFEAVNINIVGVGDTANSVFGNIRDMFKDSLLDMEGDAENFSKNMKKFLTEMLVQKALDVPVTVNGQTFKDFDEYFADWQKRVSASMDAPVPETIDVKVSDIEAEIAKLERRKHTAQIASYQKSLDALDARWGFFSRNAGVQESSMSEEQIKAYHSMLSLQESINKLKADDVEIEAKIAELREKIKALNETESLTEEERAAKLKEYEKELNDVLATTQKIAKTYADMTGWTLEEKIDASPLANIGDNLLSALQDTSKGVDDWKKEIVESMTNDLIKEIVYNDDFKNKIRALQEQYVHLFDTDENGNRILSDAEIQNGINGIADALAGLYGDAEKATEGLKELVPDIDTSPFDNLRNTFLETLMDMESGAEKFRDNIIKTLTQDLIEKLVLDMPLTVNVDGDDTTFDNFDKYSENWNSRYTSAIKQASAAQKEIAAAEEERRKAEEAGDQQGIDAAEYRRQLAQERYNDAMAYIDSLIDELVAVNAMTEDAAKDFKEKMKKAQKDTTFTEMSDSFVSALMDMDYTAADFGRQIGQTLVQKIVKEMIVSKELQTYLDAIQDAYNEALGKEGATWQSVLAAVTPAIDAAVAATEHWKPIIEEISKAFKELDNTTPLDNIRSMFLSQLMDMKSDTKDFAKSITEILTEAFIDKFVLGEEFNKRLEEWQKEYASIMGGNYSEEERANLLKQLRQAITAARDGYAEEAKIIHDFMGTANYDDQQATMNMADKITYEQADMLLGINMAQELTLEQILATLQGGSISVTGGSMMSGSEVFQQMYGSNRNDDTVRQILETLRSMSSITAVGGSDIYGEQIFNRLGTTNDYLLAIRDEVRMHLGNIAMYTSNLVKL